MTVIIPIDIGTIITPIVMEQASIWAMIMHTLITDPE